VSPPDLLGAAMVVALILYALFGGADFGGGILDALASGPRKQEQRALIEEAIGPIWEANHVWLVLVVVLLFTCFPTAFAAISVGLFTPLLLLLLGIVLRGATFTFRAYDYRDDPVQQRWSYIFSVASALAPLMLGTIVGALASGRLHFAGPVPVDGYLSPWLAAFPLATGLFAAALFVFLAAVYLTVEASGELQEDFRVRALGGGIIVFGLAVVTAVLSWVQAPLVFRGLTARGWSLPLQLATAVAAVTTFAALWTRRFRLARASAAVQVALIVAGWAAAQFPYLIVPDFTLVSASAPERTQVLVLEALAVGAVVLFPCLYLLFRVFKGERPFAVVDRR
jgi:cytochrome d ubiquinol oxidase subunit II